MSELFDLIEEREENSERYRLDKRGLLKISKERYQQLLEIEKLYNELRLQNKNLIKKVKRLEKKMKNVEVND